ncbi:hypothetical protein BXZ70DRAFT_113483 [Cristinia sonorae]|uniref:Uncharacterized protein n=1 Tax=Cristinia sonorae TaxID=1940300 RepID=A0A8K0UQS1_9AGAR|nr:hypothetical protein BXZ70DRAFT_113483 [Cristinia sonorae]
MTQHISIPLRGRGVILNWSDNGRSATNYILVSLTRQLLRLGAVFIDTVNDKHSMASVSVLSCTKIIRVEGNENVTQQPLPYEAKTFCESTWRFCVTPPLGPDRMLCVSVCVRRLCCQIGATLCLILSVPPYNIALFCFTFRRDHHHKRLPCGLDGGPWFGFQAV